ncbi:MAG: hypothetical protein GX493_08280 [Firmicutes bacterium]|nr:hypothetical protein [Bacillota bacterium]
MEAATGSPCENLIVSAFYPYEGRVYLRLYEYLGVPATTIRVLVGGRPVGLVPVDLLHREIGEKDARAVIPAFGIKTFRLEIGPENGL